MLTRAFTIYQLADLIIHQLTKVVQRFDSKLIVISDLLNMFPEQYNPNIGLDEAISLKGEIINSIKKM